MLMLVDQFTKCVECVPLPSQTAEVTARAVIKEFFSVVSGSPFEIFTDQGRISKATCLGRSAHT